MDSGREGGVRRRHAGRAAERRSGHAGARHRHALDLGRARARVRQWHGRPDVARRLQRQPVRHELLGAVVRREHRRGGRRSWVLAGGVHGLLAAAGKTPVAVLAHRPPRSRGRGGRLRRRDAGLHPRGRRGGLHRRARLAGRVPQPAHTGEGAPDGRRPRRVASRGPRDRGDAHARTHARSLLVPHRHGRRPARAISCSQGSIGRSDFPNSDPARCSEPARFLELPDELPVLPGHGPETTVGRGSTNPFLVELV